jgi:hypothetical protein
MSLTGALMAVAAPAWMILALALFGLLSTDVVDNGSATTLEQVMLTSEAKEAAGRSGARVYGVYNAIASLAGAVGALAAGLPAKAGVPASSSWGLSRSWFPEAP